MPQQGSSSTRDVATTSLTRSSVTIWLRVPQRITFNVAMLTYRALHGSVPPYVSPTCRTDAGSGPPPLNGLAFQPSVGQQSEVVLFLLLVQRRGTACQAM